MVVPAVPAGRAHGHVVEDVSTLLATDHGEDHYETNPYGEAADQSMAGGAELAVVYNAHQAV